MICLLDYGMGNIFSVYKALLAVGGKVKIISKPDEIEKAEALVLPGVGHFDKGMENLQAMDLDKTIITFINSGKPFFGICLGMQLLMQGSEEAPGKKGLSVLKGSVVKFAKSKLKVPQIGWNSVKIHKRDPLFREINDESFFYFVHSFFVLPDDPSIVAGETEYGVKFCSAIYNENIFATQFHPEKSQEMGLQVFRNFVEITKGK